MQTSLGPTSIAYSFIISSFFTDKINKKRKNESSLFPKFMGKKNSNFKKL